MFDAKWKKYAAAVCVGWVLFNFLFVHESRDEDEIFGWLPLFGPKIWGLILAGVAVIWIAFALLHGEEEGK